MKKKILKKLTFILSGVCLLATLTSCGSTGPKNKEIVLDQFSTEAEYQFDTVSWGSTVAEVADLTSTELIKDTTKEPFPEGYEIYNSEASYSLDEQSCNTSYEFQDGALNIVKFDFYALSDKDNEWIDSQIEKLNQLYGNETDKIENENAEMHMKSTVYKWETDQTMLQFTVITGPSGDPHAVIALVRKGEENS